MERVELLCEPVECSSTLEEVRDDAVEALLDPPIVHSIVRAQDCSVPPLKGPTSVFDLAASGLKQRKARTGRGCSREVRVVTRECGVVRCLRVRFADTAEGLEKERQRRARQIVPRAPKQTFRMRNSRTWDDPQN
ncbi:hypothetical protein DJFAAGMI_01288 [Comamonas sp. PE63]|uniref:Uncharacterized protein n=1 Tax=Comamonas brasiliensis TaxID=1812482 RepID=A0ABS5LPW7_9BURK|nr:hypothetical protein [Comamonas sp. PE63]MBS3018556.1 hypothetical protein [Comamonas sp. PE63]